MKYPKNRDEASAMDKNDPLAATRALFALPEDVIYLVGHSLGPASHKAIAAVKMCVETEWRDGLVGSWNSAGWFDLAKDMGGQLASIIGARPDEVMVTDTVSTNLFKLAVAALPLAKTPDLVLIDSSEFPTDQYMADSIASVKGIECRRVTHDSIDAALASGGVYIKSAVNFRTSERIDIKAYEDKAASAGTLIIWDLSHATGVIALDMMSTGARLATGCTYKYLNAGPGAPSFLYIRHDLQGKMITPLPGWMGHARPFAFESSYSPTEGASSFASGTPPILSLRALKGALACFDGLNMTDIEAKTQKLGDLCIQMADALGLKVSSPRESADRGGHVSLQVDNGYAISRALHARRFHTDFRTPDTIRFGLSPLYIRYIDIWDAMTALGEVIDLKQWDKPEHLIRNKVT